MTGLDNYCLLSVHLSACSNTMCRCACVGLILHLDTFALDWQAPEKQKSHLSALCMRCQLVIQADIRDSESPLLTEFVISNLTAN